LHSIVAASRLVRPMKGKTMTDRNQTQNEPNPGPQKNPHQKRDDQQWDQTSGKGSPGRERERSGQEPASVADDREHVGDPNRRDLDGDLDEGQVESGMDDPASRPDHSRNSQNPDWPSR
jgi:hypothetical protein